MFTYLILNIAFITCCLVLLRVTPRLPSKPWWMMCAALLVLTLIFDSIMITLGFFSYAPEKILGITIGRAPVEDFAYSLLAAIIVPALWYKVGKK